jgi:macrolide-specific efflux system membrane fusion protein
MTNDECRSSRSRAYVRRLSLLVRHFYLASGSSSLCKSNLLALLIWGAVASSSRGESLAIDAVVLRPMVEAEVPARQTGVLAKIAVEEGAVVNAEQTLASLDDRAARLAVTKAELEREQAFAKANNQLRIQYADKALEVARAEMQRSAESNEQFARSISQSQLDVERLTVEKLELERQQAEHDIALDKFELRLKENAVETAKLDLELHAVRAPFAGVVALVRGRPGEWVQPGTPVLRLVAIERLRAEGFAPAVWTASNVVGAKVRFALMSEQDEAPGFSGGAEGVLRFVSPEVDPVSRQVRIWAEIDNRQLQLRPGQQGQLQVLK